MAKWFSSWFSPPAQSSADSSIPPEGVTKVNETLYQLYSPVGTPEVDIIFFHGLQVSDYRDAYWKTWSRDEKTIWPRTLLGKELPGARILAVSYDSCARETETGGRMVAENLVKSIIHDNKASVGRNQCPVILVGHSFGGFVIKEFLQTASRKRDVTPEKSHEPTKRIDNFVRNLSGIFYYATPHGGSKLANVVDKLPGTSPVLGFLQTLSKDPELARLNEWFREWRASLQIPAFTIAESLPTNLKIWGVNFIIVEEGSAMRDTDDYVTVADDHINVCKPEDALRGTFQDLVQFINESVRRKKHLELSSRSNDDSELLR